MKEIFSIIGGVLMVLGFVPYIRAIVRGEAKPAKASWVIWVSLDTIVLLGMFFEGTVNGQIVGAVIAGLVTVVLVLKYGVPGWTMLDKFCLGGAVLGVLLWQIFESPTVGIVASLSVIFIGSIPTFVSAWEDPSRENKLAWTTFWASCMWAIAGTSEWSPSSVAQPLTFLAVNSTMMYILFVRPRTSAKRS